MQYTYILFLGKIVATMESRQHNASLEDVAGTALLLMFLGVSMDLLGRHPSPPLQHRQLRSLHPNGTAHLRQTSATGTTLRKMTSIGLDRLVVHHQLGLAHHLITQLEVQKVNT